MNCLKKLLKRFEDYFPKITPSNLTYPTDCTNEVTEATLLARALRSKSHFSSSKGKVKERAFHPNLNNKGQFEVSTFRIDELTDSQIWTHLRDNVLMNDGDKLYGRADISVASVYESGLQIKEDISPPRHIGIVGWPDNGDKSAMKAIALDLATASKLSLKEIIV